MKKPYIIFGSIIAVIITILIVIGVLKYTGAFQPKGENVQETSYVYTTEDGFTYTESLWSWNPLKTNGRIEYIDNLESNTKVIRLYVDGNTYYEMNIPDSDYIYEYGKSVYTIDGSYSIRVMSSVDIDNMAVVAGIDNAESINSTTICTPEKKRGVQTIAKLIGNNAIVVNVYSGDENYTILKDSLSSEDGVLELTEVDYSDSYKELNKLTYSGTYISQVDFQEINLEQQKYLFAEGDLWCSSVFDSLYEIKNDYLIRLCAASGNNVDATYSSSGIFYAESGDYYLGLLSYNTNTTIVLFGSHEEAKCNIISIMQNLK